MNRISSALRMTARLSVTVSALGVLLSPVAAFAATKESVFCANLSGTTNTVNSAISNQEAKLSSAYAARATAFETNRSKWDQDLAAKRQQWDAQRQTDFTKLEAKATSDKEKAAVSAYENAVNTAVTARRAANDTARQTFRTGVESAANGRKGTVEGQLTSLKSAVAAAESTAEATCASNPAQGAAARTTFVTALRTARQAFVADRKDDAKLGEQVKALAQTRNDAIKANDATFKAAMATARQALKTAFGKDI